MTRRNRIKVVKSEIENYTWQPNGKIFFPLPDKLNELIRLFNVDDTGYAEFIKRVNDGPIEGIRWCLEECKNGYKKEEKWINTTIRQIKEHSLVAIRNFEVACNWFEVDSLNDEET